MSEVGKRITYTVRGICSMKKNTYIIWEHVDGSPVNEYEGFDRGHEFTLYPKRRLMPSPIELKKKTVGIRETKRAF